jgi:3-oxoacyl-[acyl-carrier protein] reductase
MNIDLTDKIAVVTGGSGELGRVMVKTLAACGADVAVHYFGNRSKAEELTKAIRDVGRRSLAVQADVTDLESILDMKKLIAEELGDPQIIVNNAVIQYDWTTVLEQSPEDYESQFQSSVLQNVYMAKAFVPAMKKQKWGRVIGINTECSMQYGDRQSAYISGKRGMDGVLRVLAREIGGDAITVNQVAPGYTVSENRLDSEKTRDYREKVPLHRRGTDQEIANVVAFLASDLASFISGAYIPVCGGNVMPAI